MPAQTTIIGTLTPGGGRLAGAVMVFTRTPERVVAPLEVDNLVLAPVPTIAVSDANGAFSVDLVPGRYSVEITGGIKYKAFLIDVPTSDSSVRLEDLIAAGPDTLPIPSAWWGQTVLDAVLVAADAADQSAQDAEFWAAAAIGGVSGVVYPSRANFLAATIDGAVTTAAVLHGGVVLNYVRDATGTAATTADGGKWSPAGVAYVEHWGAIADFDAGAGTDNAAAINAAIAWGDGAAVHRVTSAGGAFGIASTVSLLKSHIHLSNLSLHALDTFATTTVDDTAMHMNSTGGRTARGTPMMRIAGSLRQLAYSYEGIRYIYLTKVYLDGRQIAPGMWMDLTFNSTISHINITRCPHYGAAFLVKNGQSHVAFMKVNEWDWGTSGYLNPDTRTARNIVIECNDMHFTSITSYYGKWPLWIDRSGANQIMSLHIFNGPPIGESPVPFQGIYYGPDANFYMFTNSYIDGVTAHLYSTRVSFVGGGFLGDSDTPFMRVIASASNQIMRGLSFIGIERTSDDCRRVMTVVEEGGNNFAYATECEVGTFLGFSNTTVLMDSYLTDKVFNFTINEVDWLTSAAGGFQRTIDLDNVFCLKNADETAFSVEVTNYTLAAPSREPRFGYFVDRANKRLTVYSNISVNIRTVIRVDENTRFSPAALLAGETAGTPAPNVAVPSVNDFGGIDSFTLPTGLYSFSSSSDGTLPPGTTATFGTVQMTWKTSTGAQQTAHLVRLDGDVVEMSRNGTTDIGWLQWRASIQHAVIGAGLATTGTVNLDLRFVREVEAIALTGALTLTTSNRLAGRKLRLVLSEDGTASRGITWPSWEWLGAAPPATISNEFISVELICMGDTDASILAHWKRSA